MELPSIGVRTGSLVELGLDRAGALEVPDDAVTAGWYRLGPLPGDLGPAVIAGHVDYGGETGVFAAGRDGGSFDRSTGHYRDNVVVYARLSGVR